MSSRTELIVNLNARQLLLDARLVDRIEQAAGSRARIWVTRTLAELAEAIREIRTREPDQVVFCGGDGTFMAGVTALFHAYGDASLPRVAFAPAGTVATVAKNWGVRVGVVRAVERLTGVAGVPAHRHRTLMVRDASGTIRIGFTFGTGLVARFFDRYYAAGGRGMPTAAAICARVFAGSFVNSHYAASVLEPMRCHLVLEEREQPDTAYSLIVSSVLRNVGLHMFVTYRAERDPRRLHLVASSLDTRELGPQAWRVLLGRPLMGAGITDELVESFAVSFSDATGPYVLDGDLFTASRVDVGRGPELDVLVP